MAVHYIPFNSYNSRQHVSKLDALFKEEALGISERITEICFIDWFHADSVELQESKLMELFGFKCSLCHRIWIPICPYKEPEERKKLESMKAALKKAVKGRYMDTDSDIDSNDDLDSELDSAPAFDSVETGDVHEENASDFLVVLWGILYQFDSQK
ncbi:zinc finger, RING/FYVE/PHD-type [Artemisia annua]|uniref:Zinc finger, RING/FYVE/PHD-type n=1 Tax=Artemisia annua TaxID=35608 RepID=A0A2U1L228_ARTAN|nr:zinc finger, RING/FYVE/PHD-type [Artemisia annua]